MAISKKPTKQKEQPKVDQPKRRRIEGIVVSCKMKKTVVVEVVGLKKHPRYRRIYKVTKRYKVHDPDNKYHLGDKVIIEECRPLSRDKKWRVLEKVKGKSKK